MTIIEDFTIKETSEEYVATSSNKHMTIVIKKQGNKEVELSNLIEKIKEYNALGVA